MVLDVGDAVVEHQFDPRIRHHVGDPVEEALADAGDAFVDLALHDAFDRGVPQHLAHAAAVAAADHEHRARRPHGAERHVREHLVVHELVALGDHHQVVEREEDTVEARPVHVDLLVGTALRVQVLVDP